MRGGISSTSLLGVEPGVSVTLINMIQTRFLQPLTLWMIRLWAKAFLLTCCNTCLLWSFFNLRETRHLLWRNGGGKYLRQLLELRKENPVKHKAGFPKTWKANTTQIDLTVDSKHECWSSLSGMQDSTQECQISN